MELKRLGWSETQQHAFESFARPGFTVGRVASEHRSLYRLYTQYGEMKAEVTGKMQHTAKERGDFPAVGDWVVIEIVGEAESTIARIHAILPRISKFSRKEAGFVTEEQIVASNVNTVFLVMGLDGNFNLRRIERMLIPAWESGAAPVIVLTKADLCDCVEERIDEVKTIALGIPVYAVSSVSEKGLENLKPYLTEGETAVLLGSSGVGKSSLLNRLMGQSVQTVSEVRAEDHRGRHTTTYRQLLMLPDGGVIIDTPGMRELQLWEVNQGIGNTFEDIEQLSERCRFRDCQHRDEPGCAVQEAIRLGRVPLERFTNYEKMKREWKRIEKKKKRQDQAKDKKKYSRLIKHGRKLE